MLKAERIKNHQRYGLFFIFGPDLSQTMYIYLKITTLFAFVRSLLPLI